jgi:hypothetical protein
MRRIEKIELVSVKGHVVEYLNGAGNIVRSSSAKFSLVYPFCFRSPTFYQTSLLVFTVRRRQVGQLTSKDSEASRLCFHPA